MDCSQITNTAILAGDCTSSGVSGTESLVYFMNLGDINKTTSTMVNNVLTAFVMKTGKYAKPFTSLPDSTVGSYESSEGTYKSSFTHKLSVVVFVKTEDTKAFINDIINARVVAIVGNRNEGKAGDTKYEVYGYNAGLKATAKGDTKVADGVYYTVEFSTPKDSSEATLPNSLFKTSLELTETLLASLINPVIP